MCDKAGLKAILALLMEFDELGEALLLPEGTRVSGVLSGIEEHTTGQVRFLVETTNPDIVKQLGNFGKPPPGSPILQVRPDELAVMYKAEDATDDV